MSTELRQYVRDALSHGISRDKIREQLLAAGWRPEEIESALGAFAEIDGPVPVPRRQPYLSAREAFFYLVLFVTLYITAINVGVVLFQLVNRVVPDTPGSLANGTSKFSAPAVRGAVAGIVIAFPIFLFMSRLIGRAMARDPEKRTSKIRKWLTYITLFVSACVMIGDLTFLVTQVLSGDLVLQVGLKILAVFLIAGVVFIHYLADLRREEDRAQLGPSRPSWLARGAGAATGATLISGLILVGSPGQERARRIDAERTRELRQIVDGIEEYYAGHRALPESLGVLTAQPTSRIGSAQDPATREPYEYRIVDSTVYELGATFESADTMGDAALDGERPPRFWRHNAGRQVYRLTIPPRARTDIAPPVPRPAILPR